MWWCALPFFGKNFGEAVDFAGFALEVLYLRQTSLSGTVQHNGVQKLSERRCLLFDGTDLIDALDLKGETARRLLAAL